MIGIKVECRVCLEGLSTVVFRDREQFLSGPLEPELLTAQAKGVSPAPVSHSQAAAILSL